MADNTKQAAMQLTNIRSRTRIHKLKIPILQISQPAAGFKHDLCNKQRYSMSSWFEKGVDGWIQQPSSSSSLMLELLILPKEITEHPILVLNEIERVQSQEHE